jgi:amidase
MDICLIDGGNAFHKALALSEEPPTYTVFRSQPSAQVDATTVMETNIAIRKYHKQCLDYWIGTANLTETGKPVDAFIMPFAPCPPPAPGKMRYFGR